MPAAWNARPSAFFFPGLLCFPGYCSRSRRPSRCGSGPKGMPLFGGIPVRAGPVSRVLFPGRTPGPCHLSRAAVSCRLKQPTPGIGRATLNCRYTRSCNPRDVLPGGIAAPAVGSYPAFSPLPAGITKIPAGGRSLLRSYTLTDIKSLACAVLCVARTFLSRPRPAATGRACPAKVIKIRRIPAPRLRFPDISREYPGLPPWYSRPCRARAPRPVP